MNMKRIIAIVLCLVFVLGICPVTSLAATNTEDIVILYENDVHCVVEGYSKLAAMKKELQQTYSYVGVVSGGDYIQGNSLGVISRGEYIVKLMNLVGYDAVTLGNHEFDFHLSRLEELIGMMDTKPICSNFQKIGEEAPYFKPYSIVSYGDVDIAYIGITTPSTISSSSPAQFKDENGEFLYTFHPTDLYDLVQANIDSAKAEGAEYVIALSHIGYAEDSVYGDLEDVEDLIRNTNGFDVVLDAHSHTVIEGKTVVDEGGNEVLLSSTGTKLEYIGKLTVSDGKFTTELVKTADYQPTDPAVDGYIKQIYEEYAELGNRKVAVSEVDLITKDADGNRLVRHTETNLGSLCADAFRSVTNADIGYINGGNLRSDILAGDITFNDLLNVLPFNNTVVLAEISGQTLRDMMEMAMKIWPEENGAFPHTSGITFSVNTAIPSSVELNEQEEFIGVSGQYRVYDMKVFNRETGKYEPIDLTKTYTIAATNYYLLEYGSGMKMLENSVIVQNDGLLDVEVLERYIMEELGGAVGQKYAEAIKNITYTEGEIHTPEDETDAAESTPGTTDEGSAETDTTETTPGTTDDGSVETDAPDRTVLIVCITLGAVIILAAIFFAVRRIGSGKRKA
jgi:2',3'-cyclic-nucleotide 2'-phosphodiesterase (5'-nucleotidase family)